MDAAGRARTSCGPSSAPRGGRGSMPRALLAFEPPDGGVAENVLQLALGLRAHGWEVELARPGGAIVCPGADAPGAPIPRLELARGYGAPARDARAFRGLRALLRDGR